MKKAKIEKNASSVEIKVVTVLWSCQCWDGNQIWTVPLDQIIWRDQVDDQGFLPVQVPCPMCFLLNALTKVAPVAASSHIKDLEGLRQDQIEAEDEESRRGKNE